jgi:putative NADPH-quinone reductase
MHVLTVYAHPNPRSFCHAVLEQLTRGLSDTGHSSEVVDLYAIGFDPVLGDRDAPDWMDRSFSARDHVFFNAVNGADADTRHQYLERAYRLGRESSDAGRAAA